MCQYFYLFSIYKWGKDTFKCVNDTLIERVQGTIVCVQDTAVYVSRARLYMCPGHNHRTRLTNVTETHFNQTIVGGAKKSQIRVISRVRAQEVRIA